MAAFEARMPEFRPTKASPPARRPRHVRKSPTTDHSFRSEQQLRNLSPEEVDFLDAVFECAGPTAVGFMAVFEAYNRVLEEWGLASDEVVGYAKLLKVGNWRGETWREKWTGVKNRFGYGAGSSGHARASQKLSETTTHSSRDQDPTPTSRQADYDLPQYHNALGISFRTESLCDSDATFSMESNSLLRSPRHVRGPPPLRTLNEVVSVTSEGGRAPSTTPPSYRTTEKEILPFQTHRAGPSLPSGRLITKPKAPLDASAARKVVAAARERKGSVVNEDEAWKKIQMERDAKAASQFYYDRLTERCWDIWKNGYRWIIVTSKQIDEARENLILRVALQRWRKLISSRQLFRERIVKILNTKRLKHFFRVWANRLKTKQREKWRQDMRVKLKTVQNKRELRVQKDAWAKWQHLYHLHLAAHRYHEHVTITFFKRWYCRLSHIDKLETHADEAIQRQLQRLVIRSWTRWKRALELSLLRKAYTEQANRRTLESNMLIWRRRTIDFRTATVFHNFTLMKSSLESWKAARDRLYRMNGKADKQLVYQGRILLRAVLRVWKARERGKLLERVIHLRYLRNNFATWYKHLQARRRDEGMAISFARRPRSNLIVAALRTWRHHLAIIRNTGTHAIQFHAVQLIDRALLTWRIALRDKLKSAKLARIADKFFTTRRAWGRWRFRMKQKRCETLLKELQTREMKKWFAGWAQRTEQARMRRISEQIIQDMVAQRLVRNALARWTSAVIDIKLRELEISQQYDLSIQAMAFKKWEALCIRHTEELSLMESYRYVKREECLRKFFYRWLATTRSTRRRRTTLSEKVDKFHSTLVLRAWDKWRSRFVEEKLSMLEHDFVSESRRNLLFRTFGVWHSKTKSLPALRFRATQLKSKYFGIWRSALPSALQAKKAREAYQKTILSTFIGKWVDTYRAKVALKAVARARYLRLPTAVPRVKNSGVRHIPPSAASSNTFHSRHTGTEKLEDDPGPSISAFLSKTSKRKASTSSLLGTRTCRDASSTRSSAPNHRLRQASPARSAITSRTTKEAASSRVSPTSQIGEENRGRLWLELQEVRRRNKLFAKDAT